MSPRPRDVRGGDHRVCLAAAAEPPCAPCVVWRVAPGDAATLAAERIAGASVVVPVSSDRAAAHRAVEVLRTAGAEVGVEIDLAEAGESDPRLAGAARWILFHAPPRERSTGAARLRHQARRRDLAGREPTAGGRRHRVARGPGRAPGAGDRSVRRLRAARGRRYTFGLVPCVAPRHAGAPIARCGGARAHSASERRPCARRSSLGRGGSARGARRPRARPAAGPRSARRGHRAMFGVGLRARGLSRPRHPRRHRRCPGARGSPAHPRPRGRPYRGMARGCAGGNGARDAGVAAARPAGRRDRPSSRAPPGPPGGRVDGTGGIVRLRPRGPGPPAADGGGGGGRTSGGGGATVPPRAAPGGQRHDDPDFPGSRPRRAHDPERANDAVPGRGSHRDRPDRRPPERRRRARGRRRRAPPAPPRAGARLDAAAHHHPRRGLPVPARRAGARPRARM